MRLILRAIFGTLCMLAPSIGGAWGAVPATSAVQPLWFSRYPAGKVSAAYAMALGPDGSKVYVAGYVAPTFPANLNYQTVTYDAASGAELWAASYDGPAAGVDVVVAAVASPDGSTLYVTGRSEGQQFDSDWATIAYDTADGTQLWLTRYTGGPPGYGNSPGAIGISPDGSTLYVTGETTIAYDAATGTQLWQSEIAYAAAAGSLGVSPDGSRVYVGAEVYHQPTYNYLTVAYDAATGAKAWSAEYDGPGGQDDVPTALGVSPDGTAVYVTGRSVGVGSGDDYATIAYETSDGSQQWVERFTGPGDHSDVPVDVGVAPDGSKVFVTGTMRTGYHPEYLTLALDSATGQQQWASAGAQRVVPSGLAVGPDGSRVYVTGQQFDTVAYDTQRGNRVWIFGSGLGGATNAAALAIDPTGAYLYLTGNVQRSGGYPHIATAALSG